MIDDIVGVAWKVAVTQWRDVVELLRVNRAIVDWPYLNRWAQPPGIADDLARANLEATSPR